MVVGRKSCFLLAFEGRTYRVPCRRPWLVGAVACVGGYRMTIGAPKTVGKSTVLLCSARAALSGDLFFFRGDQPRVDDCLKSGNLACLLI